MTDKTLQKYRKDPDYETQLQEMNERLQWVEEESFGHLEAPQKSTIFVIGVSRSGHTLLGQLLISRFRLAYPTNFIARFWKTPGLGAMIQRLVVEPAAMGMPGRDTSYVSEHGLTKGINGLHEFSYFWQDLFQFGETHYLEDRQWRKVDIRKLCRCIASIESEFGNLPVMFKNGSQLALQAPRLADVLPKALFIVVERDIFQVAQSTALMRLERYGSYECWHGCRPPEYSYLKKLPWWEQVAGQVVLFARHLEKRISQIDGGRVMRVNYQAVCADPRRTMDQVAEFVSDNGDSLEILGSVPESFECSDNIKVSREEVYKLRKAIERFQEKI